MILITAVIKPFKLDEVKESVRELGVTGMTVSEARGFGRQRGHSEVYRGAEYKVEFVPKLRVEMIVADEVADQIVEAVAKSASTEKIGDGKIWTTPVSEVVRIRTGQTGADAL